MTGSTADYGADFNRGALLAEEEINAAGGINGRPIKLVNGDSKNSPRDGVAGIPPAGRRREGAGDHLDHDRRDRSAVPALARDRHADDLRRRDHAGDPQGRPDGVLQLSAGRRRGKGDRRIHHQEARPQDRGDHLRELVLRQNPELDLHRGVQEARRHDPRRGGDRERRARLPLADHPHRRDQSAGDGDLRVLRRRRTDRASGGRARASRPSSSATARSRTIPSPRSPVPPRKVSSAARRAGTTMPRR